MVSPVGPLSSFAARQGRLEPRPGQARASPPLATRSGLGRSAAPLSAALRAFARDAAPVASAAALGVVRLLVWDLEVLRRLGLGGGLLGLVVLGHRRLLS